MLRRAIFRRFLYDPAKRSAVIFRKNVKASPSGISGGHRVFGKKAAIGELAEIVARLTRLIHTSDVKAAPTGLGEREQTKRERHQHRRTEA
ncbi:MAG: hypothetical protein WKF84_23695 [Pyrinomonadaceae bacterium]